MALKELSLQERLALSPEEKRRRYREAVKPFVDQNFTNVKYDNEGNFVSGSYVGKNDSPTAGLTKQNIADKTAPYSQNNGSLANTSMPEVTTRQLKTANDYWGQIYTVMSQDPVRGNQLAEQAKYFSTQYGNPLYNPYQTATVSPELKQLFGVESFSSEWVAENYGLLANLERNASGSPKAPSKDSTDEQILAYYYSQILDAENNTLKAEQEIAALKQQISEKVAYAKLYGTGKTVDEIFNDLDMSDYTTLKAMEDKKLTSQPYELTRAVNYSSDLVYGMIQAAMDSKSSDITGITDFQAYGAKYSNAKYEAEETQKRIDAHAELTNSVKNQRIHEDNGQMPEFATPTVKEAPELQTRPGKEHQTEAEVQPRSPANDIVAESNRRKAERLQEDNGQMPGVNKNTFEQPEEPIDIFTTESKLAELNAQLEAVDSDENAMPFEQYEQLEAEKNQLESQIRAYKYAHPEEYVAEKYAQYRNDPKFSDKVTQGSQMENESDGHEQYSDTYADPRSKHSALTQDEKDMYNYLLATQGTDAANQYIADLQTAVNARQGAKVAEKGKDNALGQALYNASAGVVNSLQGLASNFTNEVRPTGAAEFARAELSKTNSDLQNIVNDFSYGLGNMAPSILLSSLTGGIGGAALAGFSLAGNAYNEAMKSGALSTSEARMYGMMVGASEAFLGYMLGGISKLGNSTALKSLTQSISKIDNVFLRASAKIGANMFSEAGEELLQASIEPLLQNWILGMENDINMFSEESMYSAFMGALTAMMLEGGSSAMSAKTEIRNERSIGKTLTESGHTTQLVELAKNSKNTDIRESAKALEAGTLRWTEGNLGRLAIEYRDAGGDISFLNQPVESNIQPAVSGVTTDKDAAMALTRAIRGQATESDLELLEKGAYIPGHEDVSAEISKAAKSLREASKAMDAKENQLMQLKQDMDKASGKVTEAKEGLAKHLRGVVRIQNNDLLGKAMVDKRHAEREVNRTLKQMYQVSQAGLKPQAQQKDLDVLEQQLKAAEIRVDELMAGNREATVFHGQIANAQKGLDAANDNYAMAELQMDGVWYEYKAAERNFQEVVSNSVNRAFGDNVLALLESDIAKADALAQQQAQTKQDLIKALETIRNNKASANERAAAEDMLNEFLNTPEAQAFLERQDKQRPYYNETLDKEWNAARDKHEISDEQMAQIMHEKLNEMPEAQGFLNQQQVEGEQYEKQLTEEWLAAKDKRAAEREAEAMKPETAQEAQKDEVAEQVEETTPAEPAEATKSPEVVVTEMDYAAKRLPADIARQVIDNHIFYTEHQGGTPEAVAMEWEENSQYAPEILNDSVPEEERAQLLAQFADAVARANMPKGKAVRGIKGLDYAVTDHTVTAGNGKKTTPRKKKLLSAQKVIQQAASDFELPARFGIEASFKNVPEPVRAYHNSGSVGIRVAPDVGLFAHEVGEYLNTKYKFSQKHGDMAEAMVYNLPNEFFEAYADEALPSEATAEMVYLYLTDENAAYNFAGTALDTFLKELDTADRRKLKRFKNRIATMMEQTVDEINTAQITSGKNRDQRTFESKIRDALRRAQYNYADNFEPAARADRQTGKEKGFVTQDKHIESALSQHRRANTIAAYMITDNLCTPDGEIVGPGLTSAIGNLNHKELSELSQYMIDMRALDWLNRTETVKENGVKREVPAPRYVYGNNTSKETIQNRVNNTSPKVKVAAQRVWDWYKDFEQVWMVDNGRLSPDDFAALWAAEPHYVPLRRVIDHSNASSAATSRSLEQLTAGIKAVEGNGSQRDFAEPISALMQSVVNITNGTLKNDVGRTILWQLHNTELLGNMAAITPASLDAEQMAGLSGRENDYGGMSVTKPDGTNLYGVVDETGKTVWLQINDPVLQELLNDPNPVDMQGWMRTLGKVSTMFNANVTTLSSKFRWRNVVSDMGTAWRNSPSWNIAEFLAGEIKALGQVANSKLRSNDFMEWMAAGGMNDGRITSGIGTKDAKQLYREINPNLYRRVTEKVNELLVAFESATRYNMYHIGKNAALKEGQSASAARAAGRRLSREGTTDFNRRGAKMAGFSSVFRFGNAIIQGNYQSIRSLVDSSTAVTEDNMKARIGKVGLDIVCRTAAVALMTKFFMDDKEKEQYERMDAGVKYSGWVIPWSQVSGVPGDLVVIPYPKDALSALMTFGAALADGALNGGDSVWDEMYNASVYLANSLNFSGSPIVAPVVEALSNTTWYGGKIVPGSLEDRHVLSQHNEDTSLMARMASTGLYNIGVEFSPMKVDYILKQYGGGVYNAVAGATENIKMLMAEGKIDPETGNIFNAYLNDIKSGFRRNAITSNNISTTFYDGINLLNDVVQEQNNGVIVADLAAGLTVEQTHQAYTDAKAILKHQIQPIKDRINELYDEIEANANDPALTAEEKERLRMENKEEIYDLQLSGIMFVDDFKAKYCGDSVNGMTTRREDATNAKGYEAFNQETLPKTFRDKQDDKALTRLRDFYQQDTSKTSFRPTYPPDFVDADNVLTAWDKVDSKTKSSMENVWTDTYIAELNTNGFMSEKDYDKVKNLASEAKRKANAAAKEVYTIKYKFKEKD